MNRNVRIVLDRRFRGVLAGLGLLLLALPAAGESRPLAGFLTDLYGGDGVQLAQRPEPGPISRNNPSFHFEQTSFRGLATLGREIASSLSFISAGGGGSSYTFDIELGVPVQTSEIFGPLVGERADTIGARRLSLGLSYTRVDFTRYNGAPLSRVSINNPSVDTNGDGILGLPPDPEPDELGLVVELDELRIDLDLDIEEDVFAILGKYGFTDFWDAEVIVPIIRLQARAHAEASIECNSINEFLCAVVHHFDTEEGSDPESYATGGSATGIGDILLRTKYHFLHDRDPWPDLAIRGQIKLPTGDEDDLLGTGETDFELMLIASQTWWRITPHLNLGYELSTGRAEFDNLRYAVGFEARAHSRLMLALDVVGRWSPRTEGPGEHIADIAVGGRWRAWRSLLLNVNLQFPLNKSTWLRPDVIWTLGIEYPFGG